MSELRSLPLPPVEARADQDPVLAALVDSLRQQAAAEALARPRGQGVPWMRPPLRGWNGSLYDYEKMADPFDSTASNTTFEEATKDPTKPGTLGDLAVTSLQVDYLNLMERAYRQRHCSSRPRMVCHAAGRKAGHGMATGGLEHSVMELVRGLVKESKRGDTR